MKPEKTLLQQAEEIVIYPRGMKREVTVEEIELYLALLAGRIKQTQARQALFPRDSSSVGCGKLYCRSFSVFRAAYQKGRLIIK